MTEEDDEFKWAIFFAPPCYGTYPPMSPSILYLKCPACRVKVHCGWENTYGKVHRDWIKKHWRKRDK